MGRFRHSATYRLLARIFRALSRRARGLESKDPLALRAQLPRGPAN